LLGLADAMGGRQSEAVPHLEMAVRLEPGRSDYTINLAKLYARMGQKQSGVWVLSRFLAAKPAADVADALGLMRLTSGDWPGSAENFKTATELEPARLSAWYHLGLVHRAMGNFDAALSDFDRALAIVPEDFASLLASGAISLQRGNLTEAESKFSKAERIRTDSGDVQRYLSDVALRKGDLQVAVELGRRATRLAPRSGAAHYQLARVLVRVHQQQEADREFAAFRDSPPEGSASVAEYWQTPSPQQAQTLAIQP
jgi:tetratricopeptide (TPR) repeat protein